MRKKNRKKVKINYNHFAKIVTFWQRLSWASLICWLSEKHFPATNSKLILPKVKTIVPPSNVLSQHVPQVKVT